jgi:hypothetical protein
VMTFTATVYTMTANHGVSKDIAAPQELCISLEEAID